MRKSSFFSCNFFLRAEKVTTNLLRVSSISPIPSLLTLKNLRIGYPTDVPVGIIQHSLDLASETAKEGDKFILSFDGKLISPGCKGEDIGDCNMWGREGPPTLAKALKILQ